MEKIVDIGVDKFDVLRPPPTCPTAGPHDSWHTTSVRFSKVSLFGPHSSCQKICLLPTTSKIQSTCQECEAAREV